jgi:hypothetical protein
MRGTVTRYRGTAGMTALVALVALALGVPMGFSVVAAPAAGAAASATVAGRASITGPPTGWSSTGFYVQLCRATEKFTPGCDHQIVGKLKGSTGQYKVAVSPGWWKIGLYYYTDFGQIVTGASSVVDVKPGSTADRNLQMAYVVPAVRGTVSMSGAPGDFGSVAYMGVQACPGATFAWSCEGSAEAYEDIRPGSSYSIDLSAGTWTLAAYYHPDTNTGVFTGTPVTVIVVPGKTAVRGLSIRYSGLRP